MRGSDDPQASGEGASTGRVVPPLSDGPHYNPHQPRVPKGYAHGGRWTRVGGPEGAPAQGKVIRDETGQEPWEKYFESYHPDGSVKERMVVNRDGSTIHSEYTAADSITRWDERHRVTTPDGESITVENDGNVQTIYDENGQVLSKAEWTREGPVPLATVQQVYAGDKVVKAVSSAFTILFGWFASQQGADKVPIYALKVARYSKESLAERRPLWVGLMSMEDLEKSCKAAGEVQSLTDNAMIAVSQLSGLEPNEIGNKIHSHLEHDVKDLNNPAIKAEHSFLKAFDETGKLIPRDKYKSDFFVQRNEKDSVRIDVLEYSNKRFVCLYDIKTGRGFSLRRMNEFGFAFLRRAEMMEEAQRAFPHDWDTLLVIEMRPRPPRTK